MTDEEIAQSLMQLAHERGAGKTFCPSDAAQRLAQDWRPMMPRVRQVAAQIGLCATQKGKVVDPVSATGPIRLSLGPDKPVQER
ncbi:MAG: DUF3253 domain-containing protein [Pseudomonadota bacterium]